MGSSIEAYARHRSEYESLHKKLIEYGKTLTEVGQQLVKDWSRLAVSKQITAAKWSRPGVAPDSVTVAESEWMDFKPFVELLRKAHAARLAQLDAFEQIPQELRGQVLKPLD